MNAHRYAAVTVITVSARKVRVVPVSKDLYLMVPVRIHISLAGHASV